MSRQATLLSAALAATLGGALALGPNAVAADDPAPGTIGGAPSAEASPTEC